MKTSKIITICICILALIASCSTNNINHTPRKDLNPKIWLHRANDPAKAKFFQYKYSGMEIDVYYDATLNNFIIQHDEDENSRITLDEWLSSIENPSDLGIWLDMKNLSKENKKSAVEKLIQIKNTFNLNGKIYVESDNCSELDIFEKENFHTSYYIPWYAADSIADSIRNSIEKYNLKTISGYYDKYDFMKRQFPEINKLIWYHKNDSATRSYYINLANNEEKIDVLLVTDDMQ